jgi:hypothetical protein
MSKVPAIEADRAEPRTSVDSNHRQQPRIDEADHTGTGRPWQIIAVGFGMHDAPAATRDLARIFDLLPELPMLTIRTASGEGFTVSRDFPSDAFLEVDASLDRIFRDNPAIAGITFPARGDRPAHTATPNEPFQSASGKESTAILAAARSGEITPEQASERLDRLFRHHSEEPEPSSSSP